MEARMSDVIKRVLQNESKKTKKNHGQLDDFEDKNKTIEDNGDIYKISRQKPVYENLLQE